MSRIGRKAIALPKGVDVKIDGQHVTVKGAKGTLEMDVMPNIAVAIEEGLVHVTRANDDKHDESPYRQYGERRQRRFPEGT